MSNATLIKRATQAHRRHCLRVGARFENPAAGSDVEWEDGRPVAVNLHNVRGDLARYTVSACGRVRRAS